MKKQLKKLQKNAKEIAKDIPSTTFLGAGLASTFVEQEAFRSIAFEDLPSHIVKQLRRDGTRGELRTMDEAREIYDQNIPAEAKGSIEGIESITNDPEIHWMHKVAYSKGGDNSASNGIYGDGELNRSIGNKTMSEEEISESEVFIEDIAEQSTPGVSGDFMEVAGNTLETGALGGVLGGGISVANRLAQIEGYKNVGRNDLAAEAEKELGKDAAKGALNGIVRGTSVAVTQAVIGSNPITAGIGLVAPDAIDLITKKDSLTEDEYQKKALGVVGKGAVASALVCAGPVGWLGLVGFSLANSYGKAAKQGNPSSSLSVKMYKKFMTL